MFKYKGEFLPHYTTVLDIERYKHWLDYKNTSGVKMNNSEAMAKMGYGKSFICQLLHPEKYGFIAPSAQFIASAKRYHGIEQSEWFKDVKVTPQMMGFHQQDRAKQQTRKISKYAPLTNFRRYDEEKLPDTYYAR